MKLLSVKSLAIEEVKVIRFARFKDHRGYFTEHYRKSDFEQNPEIDFMHGIEFSQANESYSKKGTVRGLHFQWNPYMGKLVRTVSGRMIDIALDIRKGSPKVGKAILYDMPVNPDNDFQEWIWIPPGFAHGNFFTENTIIEYFCSGEYSPGCEAGISPLSSDIDWGLCDKEVKNIFNRIVPTTKLISDKDKNGLTFTEWITDSRSDNFVYGTI
jgi:dTDP-4-dehydrorhamnose 3,5-epimerase